MYKKWFKSLLGLTTIILLLTASCITGEAYVVVNNRATLSYSSVVGVSQPDTWSDTVQLWVYEGPSMSVVKTTRNMVSGEEGYNTKPISAVPGDTIEINIASHNIGDTYAFIVIFVDTFPAGVGDPASNNMSYVSGSETSAINGSLPADSISWSTDAGHTWNAWQTYSDAVSGSIPNTCTGIRWRWNIIPSDDLDNLKSWVRTRYEWYRNSQ